MRKHIFRFDPTIFFCLAAGAAAVAREGDQPEAWDWLVAEARQFDYQPLPPHRGVSCLLSIAGSFLHRQGDAGLCRPVKMGFRVPERRKR